MVRSCLFLLFAGVGSSLIGSPPDPGPLQTESPPGYGVRAGTKGTVFLGCGFTDADLLSVTASLAGQDPPATFLLDSVGTYSQLKEYLTRSQPRQVIPLGFLTEDKRQLDERLGRATEPALTWSDGPPLPLWKALVPRAPRVVVCPAQPRPALLQATCLAGVLAAPLYVLHDEPGEIHAFERQLATWGTTELFAVGDAVRCCQALPNLPVTPLRSEHEVSDLYLHYQLQAGPVETLVVANPADMRQGPGGMSVLAPWIALQKRAALLLTNDTGDNVPLLVERALKRAALRHADTLLLVADLRAIPPERRLNPVPGKDAFIEMEPLTPVGNEPFSFATGRLFHKDAGLVTLLLARQRLLTAKQQPLRALVVSNPAGGLPLLESFSRTTAHELQNRGYATTTLFGHAVHKDEVRRLLPEQDVFLWEGHHSTLTRDYGLPDWPERLQPGLVFLQSCLALCEPEALPLLERGAVGLIGTSTRTYSASGGACSLAFFDALLYEHQTVGSSLRQAKNYLLAYALLKDQRLGLAARLRGASLRSAWAFTLWGDPTLTLPQPEPAAGALPALHHEVHGQTIVLYRPRQQYDPVAVAPYRSQLAPNARLAGLVYKDEESAQRRLAPLLFAEVHLPRAPHGKVPRLHSRLPSDRYVFCWDARRRCGYLLVDPRPQDRDELRFHVHWEPLEEKDEG